MNEYVLDASALLAAINGEPGGDVLGTIADPLLISAVNLSEVVARLADRGMPADLIRGLFAPFELDVRVFDPEDAYAAGLLRPPTRALGLSFGDRACVALAQRAGATILTAERAWRQLDVGVDVRLLR